MAGEYDAAIAASAQVASTALNTSSAANANKKQREWMEGNGQLQHERQKELWNMTNDFNLKVSDPAFQMQRYKDAGLSPWLVYGKPNNVEASSPTAPLTGNYNHQRADHNYGEVMQKYIGIKMAQKQMQNIDAQTLASQATANNQNASAEFTKFNQAKETSLFPGVMRGQSLTNDNLNSQNEKITAEIANIGAQLGKTQQEIQNLQQSYEQGIITIQNLIKAGKYQDAQTRAVELGNKIIEATSTDKIAAENAKNKLTAESKGMSEKSLMSLPTTLGGILLNNWDNATTGVESAWERWKKAGNRGNRKP